MLRNQFVVSEKFIRELLACYPLRGHRYMVFDRVECMLLMHNSGFKILTNMSSNPPYKYIMNTSSIV
jgi:hypothetical protein